MAYTQKGMDWNFEPGDKKYKRLTKRMDKTMNKMADAENSDNSKKYDRLQDKHDRLQNKRTAGQSKAGAFIDRHNPLNPNKPKKSK